MNRKLTAETAQSILNRVASGEAQKDLAVEYQVSPAAISNLVAGKSWVGLTRTAKGIVRHGTKLSREDLQGILLRLSKGAKPAQIAADYGVTRQTIANIKRGRAWAEIPRPDVAPARPVRRKVWET